MSNDVIDTFTIRLMILKAISRNLVNVLFQVPLHFRFTLSFTACGKCARSISVAVIARSQVIRHLLHFLICYFGSVNLVILTLHYCKVSFYDILKNLTDSICRMRESMKIFRSKNVNGPKCDEYLAPFIIKNTQINIYLR